MSLSPETKIVLDSIYRERSSRVRSFPFKFLRDTHDREEAFDDAYMETQVACEITPELSAQEVEEVFRAHAQKEVNRRKPRRNPTCGGEMIETYPDSPNPAGPSQDRPMQCFQSEDLLVVRMIIKRGFLPPEDLLDSAALAALRDCGIDEPTRDQLEEQKDRLRGGDLPPRRKMTRERMADIEHYVDRASQIATQLADPSYRAVANRVAGTMDQIRAQQKRSNHGKSHRPIRSVVMFADLRARVRKVLCAISAHELEPAIGPVPHLNGDTHILIIKLATNFERFAELFPRGDHLGCCLRHARDLARSTANVQVRHVARKLWRQLKSMSVLAKISNDERTQLGILADQFQRLADTMKPRERDHGALCMIEMWLRRAAAPESSRRPDTLPGIDAMWWTCIALGKMDEFFHVLTEVRRLYKLRHG
jgi:hypothetical protein